MTVKVSDFGLSVQTARRDLSSNTIAGTPQYISPEALSGAYSEKSDVFAFGALSCLSIVRFVGVCAATVLSWSCSLCVLSPPPRAACLTMSDNWLRAGMILWQLLTRKVPYSDMQFANDIELMCAILDDGLRPTIPQWCPPAIARILTCCWQHGTRLPQILSTWWISVPFGVDERMVFCCGCVRFSKC